jgi:hypothetical protein
MGNPVISLQYRVHTRPPYITMHTLLVGLLGEVLAWCSYCESRASSYSCSLALLADFVVCLQSDKIPWMPLDLLLFVRSQHGPQ